MCHARRALRAGLLFAFMLSIAELAVSGRYSGSFVALYESVALVAVRIAPTLMHVAYTLIGYVLLRRQMPVVRVWLIFLAAHIFFNAFMADAIGSRAEEWARGLWRK
jgi:hypothetical protein